jgi:hypothetical protein
VECRDEFTDSGSEESEMVTERALSFSPVVRRGGALVAGVLAAGVVDVVSDVVRRGECGRQDDDCVCG